MLATVEVIFSIAEVIVPEFVTAPLITPVFVNVPVLATAFAIAAEFDETFEKVVVPLPQNMEEITRTLREEIEYQGLSVIIPRRECIQTLARKAKAKAAQK